MSTDLLTGLPGLRDFYPEDWQEISYILEKMRDVAKSYGYQEYDGPSLELVELIEAKSGEGLIKEIFQILQLRCLLLDHCCCGVLRIQLLLLPILLL